MEEKKKWTKQQEMNKKRDALFVLYIGLVFFGAMFAYGVMSGANEYYYLRADENMDDPTIPYNERDNATYTFTDDWLSEKHNRLIWWAVPGVILVIVGYALRGASLLMPNEEKVHKTFCEDWSNQAFTDKEKVKYCPECGLKLSRLDEKK